MSKITQSEYRAGWMLRVKKLSTSDLKKDRRAFADNYEGIRDMIDAELLRRERGGKTLKRGDLVTYLLRGKTVTSRLQEVFVGAQIADKVLVDGRWLDARDVTKVDDDAARQVADMIGEALAVTVAG